MSENREQSSRRRDARLGRVRLETRPSMEVRVYPNAVYVIEDGKDIACFTPEQWAEAVEIVGIAGLHRFPEEAHGAL